jgi:hypothetical protein
MMAMLRALFRMRRSLCLRRRPTLTYGPVVASSVVWVSGAIALATPDWPARPQLASVKSEQGEYS